MTSHPIAPVLVLGAHGKTGRRIAERLQAQGRAVRPVSRSTTPRFDWHDRSTWAGALAGAASVYVTYQPDLAVPSALPAVTAFFATAVAADVRRIVLLSGRGEPEAQQAEEALQASGADWTILRCSWFAQNFSEAFLLEPVLAGEVALPASTVAEPFVDLEDVAEIAVEALTRPGHERQLHELTGPRALTFAEAIQAIADASGRPLHFVPITPQAFRESLAAAPMSDEERDLVMYLFTTVLDGRNEPVTHGVERVLGRPARDFADYARRTAATGIWKA